MGAFGLLENKLAENKLPGSKVHQLRRKLYYEAKLLDMI